MELVELDFMGDKLVVTKIDSVIYVGVKWVCRGLGLTDGQISNERSRISDDFILSRGKRNIDLPTKGGNQSTLCIELDYLPIWLAKISITSNMLDSNPEAVDKLLEYQLKAKDTLAQAFIYNKIKTEEDMILELFPETNPSLITMTAETIRERNRLKIEVTELNVEIIEKDTKLEVQQPIVEYYERVLDTDSCLTATTVAKILSTSAKMLNSVMHQQGVIFKQNGHWNLYAKYQDKGYTKYKTYIDAKGVSRKSLTWTEKGLAFLEDIWEGL